MTDTEHQGDGPASHRAPKSYLRQFLTGVSGEAFSQFVTIVTQLLLIPTLLLLWGQERLGVWLIMSAIPTYLLLGDFGLTTIFGNEITTRRVAGQIDGMAVAVHTSWYTTRIITGGGVVLAVALTLLSPLFVPNVAAHYETDTQLAMLLLCLAVCFTLAQGTVGACMRVMGLSGVMSASNAAARLAESLALIAVAALSHSMALAALAMLVARATVQITTRTLFLRQHPEFKPSTRLVDRKLIRQLLPASAGFFSFTFGNAILIQTPAIIIGNLISPNAVVLFTAARTLARMGRMVVSIINYAIEPIFTQIAIGSVHLWHSTATLHRNAIIAAGVVYFILSIAFGPLFLKWWTHGVFTNNSALYFILVASVLVEIIWTTIQVPFISTNRHGEFGWMYFLLSIITVLSLYTAIPYFGIDSTAICILFCHTIYLAYSIYKGKMLLRYYPQRKS